MAANNTQKELKRQAVENMAASRVEIVAGIHQLRTDLSPKLIFQRLIDRHTVAVVGLALVAGAASSLLIFRRKRSLRWDRRSKPQTTGQSLRQPTNGSRVLKVLAGAILPALVKSGVGAFVRDPRAR